MSEPTHARRWAATGLPVLTFHAIDEGHEPICFSPQRFLDRVVRLQAAGYRSLGLSDVAGCLRRGDPLPGRCLAVTFDDGYRSVYDVAFAALQRCGWTATVFLAVGDGPARRSSQRLPSLGGRAMLSWSEIRDMHRAGFTFGAHTLTHPDLSRLPAERAEAEILGSKAVIEDALGAEITCFAYPYGRYDDRSRAIVRRHFACACTDRLGLATPRSDPYALERVDAYYLRADRAFGLMLTELFPSYLRARSIPRRISRRVRHMFVEGRA